MAKLPDQLDALLVLPPQELAEAGKELDDVLLHAMDEGSRLLNAGQDGEAETLLRQAEALATAGRRFDAARLLRILLGNLDASRNDQEGALAWYGTVLALPSEAGNPRIQDAMLYAQARIADIRQELDDQDSAVGALSQLLQIASEFERADYALAAAAGLTQAYLRMGQYDAGLYFIEQADQWWQTYQQQSVTPRSGDDLAALMAAVARALFYEKKDYRGALRWAQRALEIAPGTADALRVGGFAHRELGEYHAAADAYRAWVAAEPANATARNNLADALVGLGEISAAAEALAEAVWLDPGSLSLRYNLAVMLNRLGRRDEAVTELDALISIGCERERTEPQTDARPFRDAADYRRNLPTADQVDFALTLRTEIDLERGRPDLVVHDIEELLARPDPITNAVGHHYRGRLYERENDLAGALAAYGDAIATGRAATDIYADRARLLLRLGRDADALDALEALAAPGRDPGQSISGLNELLARRPDDPRVRRVRGIAHFHARHTQAARADLRAAIEGGESDWRTYQMYGLSLIMSRPTDDESTGISIPQAINALTEAVLRSADSDDVDAGDAARVLRWLLDRAFGNMWWIDHLAMLMEAGCEPPWRSTLPDLNPALLAQVRAIRLDKMRDWRASAAALEEAQAAFAAAGFPVTAARTSLYIADLRLRLYELDAVATHLEVAEKVIILTGRPVTAGLGEDYMRLGAIGLEIEYLSVYGIGVSEYDNMKRLIRIQLDARAGNYAAAMARINDAEWLFAKQETAHRAPGVSVSAIVAIAQILRQAGEPDRALALLQRIASGSPENLTAQLWATLATLHAEDFQALTRCLDEAERLAHDNPSLLSELIAMRAGAYVRHQRWDEALALLDNVKGRSFSSPNMTLNIAMLRAEAELGRGNPADAVAIMDPAIDRIEEARLELTRWELREAWSGSSVHPYRVAIKAAIAAGRPRLAFQYAEQSRSRAFLDDVSLADAEVKELTTLIRQTRDDIDWLKRLPSALSPAETIRLQGLIRRYPPELPQQPSEYSLARDWSDLIRRIDREHRDLVKRLDRAKVDALRRQGMTPVTWQQLRAAIGSTHLGQYHVLDDKVLLFLGTGQEPEVVEIPVDLDEIESILGRGVMADGSFDLRQVDLSRFQAKAAPLVAPLASRVPAGTLICLVTHERLHAIPLHVLEVDGEPFGLRNSVSYWPSASILVGHLASDSAASPGRPLVVGDPGRDLHHARVEAVTVAQQLAVAPVLGSHVSKRLVLDTLLDPESPPAVVHVAAHGTMDTGGIGAGIVLGHSPRDSDHWLQDDVLTPQDLDGVKIPAALVVLSCCRMAGGALRRGDELVSLTRAFLAAGAAAVVLSQWSVDDLSTSLLMHELYRLITGAHPGADVRTLADALRQAAFYVRSMTRDNIDAAIRGGLAGAVHDARTARTVQVDSAALAPAEAFASMRAALALSKDKSLRDAALEAEARREELWAAESDQHPFRHPHYWAPFVLVGDWRLPTRPSSRT